MNHKITKSKGNQVLSLFCVFIFRDKHYKNSTLLLQNSVLFILPSHKKNDEDNNRQNKLIALELCFITRGSLIFITNNKTNQTKNNYSTIKACFAFAGLSDYITQNLHNRNYMQYAQ
ncbi:hypothetical protein BpHYR1_025308 [Brachionus plicatilis]|uniref:Uncharacterized protein n=1 Tax=Brachionus plicatilis TaxID=10195 RepID=A0A3M7S2A2_BRAPC|nr:hypothetical protein BpHYR1_025308 [Brachionus plicatilis]